MKKLLYLSIVISIIFFHTNCGSKNDATPETDGIFIKLLGGGFDDFSTDFFIDDNGEIVGAGTTSSFEIPNTNPTNFLFFRTDANGNQMMMKGIGGNVGRVIRKTPDGGMIALSAVSKGDSSCAITLIKLKSNADIEWTKEYTPPFSVLNATIENTDGGYMLWLSSQIKRPINSTEYIHAWKMSLTGDTLRKVFYGDSKIKNRINASKAIANGNTVAVGSYNKYMRVLLTSSMSAVLWDYSLYHTPATDEAEASDVILDQGYVIAGTIQRPSADSDGLVIKTNSNAQVEWQTRFGGENNQIIKSIARSNDGGYIITGSTQVSFKGTLNKNIWVAKLNSEGTLEWEKNFGGAKDDEGTKVKIAPDGSIVVMANVTYETSKMIGILRLNQNGEPRK